MEQASDRGVQNGTVTMAGAWLMHVHTLTSTVIPENSS